jgi:hypothetical protein
MGQHILCAGLTDLAHYLHLLGVELQPTPRKGMQWSNHGQVDIYTRQVIVQALALLA